MATINLGNIKFNWKGTYAGGTAYVVDDVVSYSGSSYICKLASTGNLPTNGTYWDVMSQAGTNGTNGTDVGTTITTQGDVLYRDGSGLQRLAAGTSGQVLPTGGTGANPSWTTVGGDLSNSGSTQNVWKHVLSSTVDLNVTSYTDTGMDLSGFSALSANTDFIVHFVESRREQGWNQSGGLHQYSVDNGSNWVHLNETMDEYDESSQSYGEASAYQTHSATYYLSFTSGQTPRFKVQGRKFGSSNNYRLNYTGNGTAGIYKLSIIAIKVNP